jgi:PhnB protein
MAVKPIPDGFHSITPHLTIRGASAAIEFYKRAFDAQELMRMPMPDGKAIMHATIKIGDSVLMLNDEMSQGDCKSPTALNGSPVTIHLYVADVDKTFQQAVAAGAKVAMPVADMFWGDRYGRLIDPFGHHWSIATQKETPSPEELKTRVEAFMKQQR